MRSPCLLRPLPRMTATSLLPRVRAAFNVTVPLDMSGIETVIFDVTVNLDPQTVALRSNRIVPTVSEEMSLVTLMKAVLNTKLSLFCGAPDGDQFAAVLQLPETAVHVRVTAWALGAADKRLHTAAEMM